MRRSEIFLSIALLFSALPGFSQLPVSCPPATPPTDDCSQACIVCDLNNYQGSLGGYTAGTAPGFCGTIGNDAWIGFIAGAANMTLTIVPSNCQNGNGLTAAVYPSCAGTPLVCNGGTAGGGSTPLALTYANYAPGSSYYLVIDGYNDDECDFTIVANPAVGAQAPAVGAVGPISGPATVCPGATVTYSVAPVAGAAAYTWTAPPGATINGQASPLTITDPGGHTVVISFGAQGGQLCVTPANSCNNGTQACRVVTVQPIPPTTLPAFTGCSASAPYILPWGMPALTSGVYQTTLSSYLGCDSVVRQIVQYLQPVTKNLGTIFICPGDCVKVCNGTYCQPGAWTATCYSCPDTIVSFTLALMSAPNRGYVYFDQNSNGQRDPTESNVSGATLTTSGGQAVTTGSSGVYAFTNLSAGDTIFIQAPSNAFIPEPSFYVFDPAQPTCYNFALVAAPLVQGRVFYDLDQDGILDFQTEPRVPGMLVTTSSGQSTMTNAFGLYKFYSLPAGDTVRIGFPPQAGTVTPPFHVVDPSQSGIHNFGLQAVPGVASGYVYYDQDQSGTYSDGDQLADGVVVYTSGGAITATSGGAYVLSGLDAGDTIRVELPNDSLGTLPLFRLYNPQFSAGYTFAIQLPQGAATGRVFWDADGNGLWSPDDVLITGAVVEAGGTQLATTINGFYNFATVENGDTLRVVGAYATYASTPTIHIYSYGQVTGYDFALEPVAGFSDLRVGLANSGPFRPGFQAVMYLTITNELAITASNVQAKTVLPPFVDFVSNSNAFPFTQNGDTLCWELGTVAPDQIKSVAFTIQTAIGTPLGTPVDVPAWVLPVVGDADPTDNFYTLHRTVVNAYDPNDKLVEPAYVTSSFLDSGAPLTYTVRFQNTGNYPASFVRIIDTIQAGLDAASLRVLAASHPVTWQFTAPNVVEFHFADINLPDSTSDEPNSHGFVRFSIGLAAPLLPGEQVGNFADIYFDFNEPIRTNTAASQYVLFAGDPANNPELSVRPNPASYDVRSSWPDALPGPGRLWLVNLQGVPVLDLDIPAGATGASFNVSYVPDGLYIVLLQGGATPLYKRLVVSRAGPVRK